MRWRFNPRAHAGRDFWRALAAALAWCFNPRAHAGRDGGSRPKQPGREPVSIHAPTRGATGVLRTGRSASRPFQSTRPRGARRGAARWRSPTRSRFNPRAHAGRDTCQQGVIAPPDSVSIHAPTRGATRARQPGCVPTACFNPRAHAGRDLHAVEHKHLIRAVSIHAPTRGATAAAMVLLLFFFGFNPRAHAGRDSFGSGHDLNPFVSIHAPTRGATAGRPIASSSK